MPQTCFSINLDNPKKLLEDDSPMTIFVSYDGMVYPCCMTGSMEPYTDERGSVKEKTLKNVLDGIILEEKFYNAIRRQDACQFCKDVCEVK